MTGSIAVDIAIGLFLMYVLLGAGASAIHEIASQLLMKNRGKMLVEHLMVIFVGDTPGAPGSTGKALYDSFLKHPLIASLRQGGDPKKNPAYITPTTFAHVLLDVVHASSATPRDVASLRAALLANKDAPVQKSLLTLLDAAGNNLNAFQKKIEGWYADVTDRMSGWYKRKTQLMLLLIGAIMALLLNADTLMIVRVLGTNPTVREAVVAAAQHQVATGLQPGQPPANLNQAILGVRTNMEQSGLPIWWSSDPASPNAYPWSISKADAGEYLISKFVGIVISAIAISLGASFWFDLMSKLINLRAAGPKPKPEA